LDNGNIYVDSYPPPRPASEPKEPKHGGSSFGVVWVNEIGRAAMASDKPKFPEGSIVVREKFLTKDAAQPELLAAMIKRPAGFSPKSGDWEYLILDGTVTKVRDRKKKGDCYECHSEHKDRDFTFPLTEYKVKQ
jgi:Cytochrome P460